MKYVCIAGVLLLALIVSPFIIHPLSNNRKLAHVERSFARVRHPAQSKLIKRLSDVGLLIGNSNHCDFFVGELRSYTGTKQVIANSYRIATVWSPISNIEQPLAEIVFLERGFIPGAAKEQLPYGLREASDWSIPTGTSKQQLYIVYFLDVGTFNQGCDLRCN